MSESTQQSESTQTTQASQPSQSTKASESAQQGPKAAPGGSPRRSWLAGGVFVAVLAVLAIIFRAELTAWFTLADRDKGKAAAPSTSTAGDHSGHGSASPEATPGTAGSQAGSAPLAAPDAHELSPPAHDAMVRALRAYEEIRRLLAADQTAGIAAHTQTIIEVLGTVHTAEQSAPAAIHQHIEQATAAARSLGTAASIEPARAHFSELSSHLVALIAADRRLAAGQHIFECPMAQGFNKWLQPTPEMANPYMGTRMLMCGSEIELGEVFATKTAEPPPAPGEISHYTCPMHPWVKQQKPGTCPVCAMDLVPVTKDEVLSGVIRVDRERRQLIGVRTHAIGRGPLTVSVRAIGEVVMDERQLADVTLKFGGFIETLFVNQTGQKVQRGQTLFTIYSPDIYAAQNDYLLALAAKAAAKDEAGQKRAEALIAGARQRLRLWDISDAVLGRIASAGKPMEHVPISAPASGYVMEKDVVEGAAVEPGMRLYRIAALDSVWVEGKIYEHDIPLIQVGQPARISLTHLPDKTFEGKVSFVYPYLDGMTRTARVRVELKNPDLELKPNMYANVDFAIDRGERLLVPEAAVIYSGPRRIVFVDVGGEKLKPVLVKLGIKSGGFFEVLAGLEAGDEVVVSGNFLLASESRLKSATGLW